MVGGRDLLWTLRGKAKQKNKDAYLLDKPFPKNLRAAP
jgi:hypothetical protein